MAKNYYDILGVSRTATDKEIRSAYRKLARQYHPDVNPGDETAEAKFKEINEAYHVLSDPESRKKYDRFGENWRHADQFQRAGAGQGESPYRWYTRTRGSGGRRESAGADFGMFGDLLGDLFGGGRRSRVTVDDFPPQQVEVPVTVTLEEAYNGATRTIQTPDDPLSGSPGRTLEVNIPKGVQSGSRVHIGVPDKNGVPLDIYLRVTVAPHETFERKGDDLHTTVSVPVWDAALGGEVEVPAITGRRVALKVPPETQNGRVFRLKGKGMPRSGGSGHGDMLVTLKVVLPTKLTDEERRLFEQLRDLRAKEAG